MSSAATPNAAPAAAADAASATAAEPQWKPADYRSRIKPIWCPGCGNYGFLTALMRSLAEQGIDPKDLAIISGIGCSSRLPGFVRSYAFHGVHGRALPVALGVKLGNPRLKVIVVGGDGDGLSIGAGHFPHVTRRNIDLTYFLLDNRIYGLTKGQTSPTTPEGGWTKTAPLGVLESPMNPVGLAIAYGATFVARCYTAKLKEMQDLITQAMEHKGFSVLQVMTRCVTFGKSCGFDQIDNVLDPIPADHDLHDARAAFTLVDEREKLYTGVFYRGERPEFVESLRSIGAAHGRDLDGSAPKIDVERVIKRFS